MASKDNEDECDYMSDAFLEQWWVKICCEISIFIFVDSSIF
jgi:hypothetical protein